MASPAQCRKAERRNGRLHQFCGGTGSVNVPNTGVRSRRPKSTVKSKRGFSYCSTRIQLHPSRRSSLHNNASGVERYEAANPRTLLAARLMYATTTLASALKLIPRRHFLISLYIFEEGRMEIVAPVGLWTNLVGLSTLLEVKKSTLVTPTSCKAWI